jgi:hypothetical protein
MRFFYAREGIIHLYKVLPNGTVELYYANQWRTTQALTLQELVDGSWYEEITETRLNLLLI